MSTRKSAQQLVRESVRRILSEAPAPAKPAAAKKPAAPPEPALKLKLFGAKDTPTALRDLVVEKWSEVQGGHYKFTFNRSEDKQTGTGTVEAVNDPKAYGDLGDDKLTEIQAEFDKALATLTPADWGSIGSTWTYTIPFVDPNDPSKTGVTYDSEINMDVQKETWLRIAGLLKEDADRNAAKVAIANYRKNAPKGVEAAERALALALDAAGFNDVEEMEEVLSANGVEDSMSLAGDLVKYLPKKK
jgi:hypothetical protein